MIPEGNEDFDDEIEKLKQENEIKRMKLRLEFGADFPIKSDSHDLSLHMESQFLDNILAFERAFHNSSQIQIYDYLGKPEYLNIEMIPDSNLQVELDRIMAILNANQIDLVTLCDVDDRELYRFITEELFFAETDNIRIEGMVNTFTYEEFHPNHEFDLRSSSQEFFESFLDKKSTLFTSLLTKEAEENAWFDHFRKAFSSFKMNSLTITDIKFNERDATVQFEIDFFGVIEGSKEKHYYSGVGCLRFLYQWDYWYIQELILP